MSIEFWFESNEIVTKSAIFQAFEETGAKLLRDHNQEIYAQYSNSGLNAWFLNEFGSANIMAEEPMSANFRVVNRCVFRLNTSKYEDSISNIEHFLACISKLENVQFIVSFQLEKTIYLNLKGTIEKFENI